MWPYLVVVLVLLLVAVGFAALAFTEHRMRQADEVDEQQLQAWYDSIRGDQ